MAHRPDNPHRHSLLQRVSRRQGDRRPSAAPVQLDPALPEPQVAGEGRGPRGRGDERPAAARRPGGRPREGRCDLRQRGRSRRCQLPGRDRREGPARFWDPANPTPGVRHPQRSPASLPGTLLYAELSLTSCELQRERELRAAISCEPRSQREPHGRERVAAGHLQSESDADALLRAWNDPPAGRLVHPLVFGLGSGGP